MVEMEVREEASASSPEAYPASREAAPPSDRRASGEARDRIASAKGSPGRYGTVAIALHWVSAAAVLALFGLGFASANAADGARKAALLGLHAPLGLLVFALTLLRAAWAFLDRRPAPLPDTPRWQRRAASPVHALLYGLILLMGGSGVALMALSGAGDVLSGAAPGPLPDFWRHSPMRAHFAGALLLLALVGVHVAAALHHQFVRRDRVLARMGVGRADAAGAGPLPGRERRAVADGLDAPEGFRPSGRMPAAHRQGGAP